MNFAYWRSPRGKRAAMAVAVALAAVVLVISTTDAEARRKRHRHLSGWHPGFASIVVDAKTGKVLDEEKADALRHPASLTKIMTLYLLFERIEAGKLKLESRIKISEFAASQPPSKLGIEEDETISVEDAIKALVTRSANDIAVAIAETVAGDQATFADMMTRKARALGMSRTVFKNASGLPHREMVTTARDMATLGRAIQDRFPKLYRFFSIREFYFRGRRIANHNRLLGRVAGVDGIKTGYTNASGFNLVTSVRHKNRHIVAVVLGGRTGAARDAQMRELVADYLDDASAGPRTAPLVAEAAPAPVKTAETKAAERKPRIAHVPSPLPRPASIPVAGSSEPIRPVPVKTLAFGANGEAKPVTTAQAGVLTLPTSNFSAQFAMPMPITPSAHAENNPDAAAPAATAFANTAPSTEPQTQAEAAPPAAETEELEIEARALAATRPNAAPATVPARRVQVASANNNNVTTAATPAETNSIPPAAKTGWSIQIGAYPDRQQAKERLDEALERARSLLAKASPYTEKTSRGDIDLYRARFAGFSNEALARRACHTLKRNRFDCMAVKN